ncbi:MAG: methylthioribulose 1-phosphate dehydratase [Candidatus Melainabacteria bacterium]|nr:methylthioribulose 1-phosphate dehydratase [Candidatus Melainabacteria bacterium]
MLNLTNTNQHQKIQQAACDMIAYGQAFYSKGWNLATSSNYSAVVSQKPLQVLMTASGKHKAELTVSDFVLVDDRLVAIEPDGKPSLTNLKPSAEAALHLAIAKREGVGAVLHTHSVWSTILSERFFAEKSVLLSGYEMLKALPGIKTHETTVRIPILDNSQDMDEVASIVNKRMDSGEIEHGFLLKGHGLYTWAASLAAARNQVEALEFLFEVVGRSGGS